MYFKQLDGDDYYEPEALNKFIEYLKTNPSDLVIVRILHMIAIRER